MVPFVAGFLLGALVALVAVVLAAYALTRDLP